MKQLFATIFIMLFAFNAIALEVSEFTDYSDSTTTIDGTSTPVFVKSWRYTGTPYTLQITDSSSAVGTIQGLLYVDSGDDGDTSTLWQDLTDGTISGDATYSFFAPFTHIRINLTSGTCKARVLH